MIRAHYWCDHCPMEWADECSVIAAAYCPCCDAPTEPYDTEDMLEEAYD